MVEAAAMNPTVLSGTPKLRIKRGKTGFLDMVVLKIANPPRTHRSTNEEDLAVGLVSVADMGLFREI
jgi:hypothetical protein